MKKDRPARTGTLYVSDTGGTANLQSTLRWCAGANGLDIDGKYGPATAQATRDFQAQVGIPVDGVYGPQRWTCPSTMKIVTRDITRGISGFTPRMRVS
ncbi:peptidoglycan-binding protein [Streptomyces sp. NPDC002698]|uniref:peptidoglycan-binding domain-containing protein n=1 Tax=Streptomyces sp. NPDC002698 TaxID=3364660 RepID=UPI003680B488